MLIWTGIPQRDEPVDPTDDGDGLWEWCSNCAGTGEVEHYSTKKEVRCPDCKGWGGRYISPAEQAERASVEAEYRREY